MNESSEKSSEFTRKKVDESWKDSVDKEKETAPEAAPEAPEPGFLSFVSTLAVQTLICLGEIPHPATNRAETDAVQAKYLIDTMQMLAEKTQGNLSPEEADELNTILYELRLKFVEKTQAGGAA